MMGMLTTPTKDRTAHARAPSAGSSKADLSPITPRYRNSRMSSEVRRASHTHHVNQVGFPHREPVTRVRKVKDAPTAAQAEASTSASFTFQISVSAPAAAMLTYSRSDSQADG